MNFRVANCYNICWLFLKPGTHDCHWPNISYIFLNLTFAGHVIFSSIFFHGIWSINIDQSQNSLMGFEMALNNVEKLLKAPWHFHFPDVSTFMMSEKQAPFHTGWCVTYLDLDGCSSWWNTSYGLKATLTWQKLSFYWPFCISLSSEKCYHYQQ